MSSPVSKKMLINVMHPEETRVAIVHDGRLMELNIEISGKEQIKGNIYKGVVLRVEPGLQAAFIDIGRAKPGFLQIGELHPDYWEWREDIPEEQRKRRPRIQEVLRRGQELVVQVEKDERDNKGSALTSYLSLPGRYMVIMPGSDSTGISRKVEQEGVRKGLKEIVAGMNIPEGIGYIIRTEAVGRAPEELHKDFSNLLDLYGSIKTKASEIKNAGEIYRDSGLIIRTIRDYFSDGIDEVLVDSKDAYREAKEFFRDTMPACEKRVKLHKEKRPIFSRFQLEEQIDQIYEKRVPLPSGGSLIIEPTEALVSIDVNSGKTSGERGIEDTAFRTNMEAAEEVARQLRLRDLGGLIVIDFIDMREKKHNYDVEKTLKQALKMDKARVNLGRISEFGIMEMSRQRIAKTLNDAIHLECPHCEGRGKVKSVEAMAVSFLRKVHAAAAKGTVGEVRGGLPLEVAYYLLNRKKRELTQIENDYEIEVTVKGKTSFLLNQLELEIVKREKPHMEDVLKSEAEAEEAHKPAAPVPLPAPTVSAEEQPTEGTATAGEAGKKRKRRKKKKKTTGEGAANPVTELTESDDETTSTTSIEESDNTDVTTEDDATEANLPQEGAEEPGSKPKKRKRRRNRSKGHKEGEVTADTSETVTVEEPTEETLPSPVVQEQLQEDEPAREEQPEAPAPVSKPKKSRTPRKKKAAAAPAETVETVAVEPVPVVPVPEEPVVEAVKPRRRAPAKKALVAPVVESEAKVPAEVTAEVAGEPVAKKAAPRLRRAKKIVETP